MGRSTGIYRSPFEAPELPDTNVPAYLRTLARTRPQEIALVDAGSGSELSFGALDHAIGRCAAGLADLGLRPGDVLLIFAPNSIEWPIAALAAMAAGGVVSGANPMYSADELAHQLRRCKARFVVTVPALLATVRAALSQHVDVPIIVFGKTDDTLAFEHLLATSAPEPALDIRAGDLAALPFSSGTSGLAKGVMLTHANLLANILQFNAIVRPSEAPVALAFLPMFHIFGFTIVTLCSLAKGMKLVTIPRFEPEAFLQSIAQHRVTQLFVVPPIMQFLASHPLVERYDLRSIEYIGCGAAPLGAASAERVASRLGCHVSQGYGMTEASGCITSSPPGTTRYGASGLLMPSTCARIVDPSSGTDVAPGEEGELWFSGPQAFAGYLGDEAATTATLDDDGWVHTGDIARFDADGYLYVTDRLKELIKVNAYQVAPAELEALLLTHPAVADVAVIARADARAGERPVAYVVFRGAPDVDALMLWLGERVVEYKQLAAIVVCAEIPKSPSGKILRRLLRDRDRTSVPI